MTAGLAPDRFDVFTAVFLEVAPFAGELLVLAFLEALPEAEVRGLFAAARLVVLAFAPPGFPVDRPVADLDDFLRVFLDIRLPFVAFRRVFWDSREPLSGTRNVFFDWANLTSPGYGNRQY
jgi:hypothetical protein